METLQKATPELDKIVNESGLQLNEAETIKMSYAPYFAQIAEVKEQAQKINFENPTELDEKIARELRLKTVKIRTGSESVKDERKKIHMLKANVEQSAWNLIKTTCQLDEEMFLQVEKMREIKEKQRIEALINERRSIIAPLVEDTSIYMLGLMSDESFQELVSTLTIAKKAKEEAAIKAEQERIEAEKKEAERIEAQRIENEKLKEEALKREAEIKKERELAAKKEAELKAKAEAERLEAEKLAAKIKAEADAKLKAETDARLKLEAELKAKAEAEEVAKKAAQLAAKKAASAPDKEKIKTMIDNLSITELSLTDEQMKLVYSDINTKFSGFKTWALQQIANL